MTDSKPDIQKIILYGFLIIGSFIIGFLLWATLTTLDSAAVAPGSVMVAGSRRVVQHLEGGIVKSIFVQDGSRVKPGDLLIKLQDTVAKATSEINQNEYWALLGSEARINAELHDAPLRFPVEMQTSISPEVQAIVALQAHVLETNQASFKSSVDIYKQRIEQLQHEIAGTKAVAEANDKQIVYMEKELSDAMVLASKRLIKQSRLFALQRELAGINGKRGELKAKMSELEQKIGETKLQIISITDTQHKTLLEELEKTQNKLNEMNERRKASSDILIRTEIRAPIAGTVVNLKIHTIGGVIKPGEPIMEIVPNHEALIIEAKLNPLDIDVVHPGLKARVIFTGLSQRNTPNLYGKVIHVSADALVDPQTNKPYFEIKVRIKPTELKKLVHHALYPGMPAEVMVITQTSSPWTYLTKPIIKSFDHAFRED